MKITKWVECSQEVEIHIGADEIIGALMEGSEDYTPVQAIKRAVNDLASILRKMPDTAIEDLSPSARGLIATFLAEQEKRFRVVTR